MTILKSPRWIRPEREFLETLYEAQSSQKLTNHTLYQMYLTKQARHLPGGDLHLSEPWPQRPVSLPIFLSKYRKCYRRVHEKAEAAAIRQARILEIQAQIQEQVPVQATQGQEQVPVQSPQGQEQVPVQAPPRPQQVPLQAPMPGPIHQAPRLSLPPGAIRIPGNSIRIPGSNTRFPHHTYLLPDHRILLPNGLIITRSPSGTLPSTQSPESQALQRAAALSLARAHLLPPRRPTNMQLPLPRIRQVLGRELQGRAHLNATAIARASASAAHFPQYRQRSAAPGPSVPMRTEAISHRAAVHVSRQRQRSPAPEPSLRLSARGSREQPISLIDDEDSSPTAEKMPDSKSGSRDQTPLFARAFRTLTVGDEKSSPTSVVRLANGIHPIPSSPVVSAGPMDLGRILN
ncbi:uncharacterized protein EAE98_006292 [Botrytis deweyae]|uniref:ARID domain-containing protein n=1 Tax=Botrytis deweyae TaxID=2478750 RepID=A0ABQ7IKV9_9HELO|nr:uncharacterized protein EAE98_006292 [Botrytis deweyae]KAF7926908.1 hypothetical protein EAE98_006292 [Botrytis deweyae]